jgi:hypothetical protein
LEREAANHHNGAVHNDNAPATEAFQNHRMLSNKAHHYVASRPLVSYKEKNLEDKKCTYGKYRDGARWRCIQNLNHKEGGGEDENGQPNVRERAGDGRTGLKHRPKRDRADDDDEDGGGGGGGGFDDDGDPDEPPAGPRAETEPERKKRIRRENAQKKMADYNKEPRKGATKRTYGSVFFKR